MTGVKREAAIALGVFDAIHLGHARIIAATEEPARCRGLRRLVVTFDPHPRALLTGVAPSKLTTLEERARLVASLGSGDLAPELVVLPFTQELSETSARDFAASLKNDFGAGLVVIGENFRFGRGREGDGEVLGKLGTELGFDARTVPLASEGAEVISSTRIRSLLEEGNVAMAARLLGRSYAVTGVVVHGRARGRTIGFPTANLGGIETLIPKDGVYAGWVETEAKTFGAVVNVGKRPTVGSDLARTVEAHLFDFDEDLYDKTLKLSFSERIRDERKFGSFDALKAQISEDAKAARGIALRGAGFQLKP